MNCVLNPYVIDASPLLAADDQFEVNCPLYVRDKSPAEALSGSAIVATITNAKRHIENLLIDFFIL
jgi:hypothetical protein